MEMHGPTMYPTDFVDPLTSATMRLTFLTFNEMSEQPLGRLH